MKETTLKAVLDNVEVVTNLINSELEKVNCSPKIITTLDVAIDEIFSNIANYGYDKNGGDVVVRYDINDQEKIICITFIDSGTEYNPLAKEDPNVNANTEDRAIGGLGIYIVKKTMDDVIYKYENGKNYLTIIKKY